MAIQVGKRNKHLKTIAGTRLQPPEQHLRYADDQRQCGRRDRGCCHERAKSDSPCPLRAEPATVPRPTSWLQIVARKPALRACGKVAKLMAAAPAAHHAIVPHDPPSRSAARSPPTNKVFCRRPCSHKQANGIDNPEKEHPGCLTERRLNPDTVPGGHGAVSGNTVDLLPKNAHKLGTRPRTKRGGQCDQNQDQAHRKGDLDRTDPMLLPPLTPHSSAAEREGDQRRQGVVLDRWLEC